MNTYDSIKDSITVPQAAARYGMTIGRGSMARCPFHEDRHPSMKLNERYYYCFGCGAHGDVIDLTARLLGTTTKDTVSILLSDFNLNPRQEQPGPAEKRRPEIRQFRHDEAECASVLAEYLHLLQMWKVRYAPSGPDEPWGERYGQACRQTEAIEDALDILAVGSLEDRTRLVDGMIKTGRLDRLRKTLNDIREGERHGEEKAG